MAATPRDEKKFLNLATADDSLAPRLYVGAWVPLSASFNVVGSRDGMSLGALLGASVGILVGAGVCVRVQTSLSHSPSMLLLYPLTSIF